MAANLALSATRRLANRVSLCSELSAARRSLPRSVLPSEFAAYLALSATRGFIRHTARRLANRVSLCSELSAARRSLRRSVLPSEFAAYLALSATRALLIASPSPQSFQQPDALFFCEVWLPLSSELMMKA